MNIYSYPAFTWNPESNSWCDYIFASNFSGYYIATSQVWAHIASDGMTLYSGNYSKVVGSVSWADWTDKAIVSVEKDNQGVYVVQSMVSKDRLVSTNVTYSFVAKNPVKMTFSFASNRDIAGYVLAWDVELSRAGYAVSQTDSFAIASAKRSYSGTNSTYFYEDSGLSRFSVGISWEDAWEQYQGTNLDGNAMVVTFGPFDLKAGEAVVVDPTITTNVGSSGDTHVSEGSPTTNYGTSTSMQVQLFKDEYGTIYRNRIFIKFDLSSLPINIDITSAKLYLYMYGSTAHTRTIAVHDVSDNSWGETTITWNNKPSYDATATTTTSIGTSSGWKYFTITSDVEDAYNAASQTLSECIKDNSETTGVPTVPSSITKQFYTEEYVPSPIGLIFK
jgi:hypothetical protein